MLYLKENHNNNDIYIPINAADSRRVFIDGHNSIYRNLPCPYIDVDANGYAHVSLYYIFEHAFSKPEHLPDPLLPFHISPHGLSLSHRGQELLDAVKDNTLEAIRHAIYPVEIILWTDAFMPHNVVIKKCGYVQTCTATIGRPNDDRSGSYLYPICLGRKE